MDVFCLAYILLLTACVMLLVVLLFWVMKRHKIELNINHRPINSTDINYIKQLRHDKWVVIRYVDIDENGEEYIKDDEISFKLLLKMLSENLTK